MRLRVLFVLAVLGAGCATSPRARHPGEDGRAHARRLGSLDLSCPDASIRHVEEDALYAASSEGCFADPIGYRVYGCGKEADYSIRGEEGALVLTGVYPAFRHPEQRQWLEWVWRTLQAQNPSTPFSTGAWRSGAGFTEQVIHFNPAPGTPPWKLTFNVHWLRCKDEAPAKSAAPSPPEEGTRLATSVCGGSFEVLIWYEGPKASMPAPQGIDLPKLARALRRQLWILGRSR